jgi:hypothetical protein
MLAIAGSLRPLLRRLRLGRSPGGISPQRSWPLLYSTERGRCGPHRLCEHIRAWRKCQWSFDREGSTCIPPFLGSAYRGGAQISGVVARAGRWLPPGCRHGRGSMGVSVRLKLANDGGRKSIPRAFSSTRATPFPLVQPGLHVAHAYSAASDRVDDLRWRLGAARVPRAAMPLGVEAEQTIAERRAATVMRVGDPARGRRDRHRSLR